MNKAPLILKPLYQAPTEAEHAPFNAMMQTNIASAKLSYFDLKRVQNHQIEPSIIPHAHKQNNSSRISRTGLIGRHFTNSNRVITERENDVGHLDWRGDDGCRHRFPVREPTRRRRGQAVVECCGGGSGRGNKRWGAERGGAPRGVVRGQSD